MQTKEKKIISPLEKKSFWKTRGFEKTLKIF